MSWKWEEMTAPEFAAARERSGGVCILPCGVIEKHGAHLPLGTDSLAGHRLAERAAEREPAVVYPFFYFGMIQTAKHQPGTIAYSSRLVLDVLRETCDEIARNGFRKILILSAHGGNHNILGLFVRSMLEAPRDYAVYLDYLGDYWKKTQAEVMESAFDYHGGELETSLQLALDAGLVRLEAVGRESGADQDRAPGLAPLQTPVNWYARFPNHYAGDAAKASAEKGRTLVEAAVAGIAGTLRRIKSDDRTLDLMREFYARVRH
jgi:creatinine amidohydrolase